MSDRKLFHIVNIFRVIIFTMLMNICFLESLYTRIQSNQKLLALELWDLQSNPSGGYMFRKTGLDY